MFRALVIEDSVTYRQALINLLSYQFPFMVLREAGDGKEALEKINSFLPDLVFMDIELPGENGLELTQKLKSTYPEIIIIILTNYDLSEYWDAARRYGASHFISKGSLSTVNEILVLVKSILSDMGFAECDLVGLSNDQNIIGEGEMTVKELQKKARTLGIKLAGLRKTELIKAIQIAEGNFDCFGSARGSCDQMTCLFRKECLH